jgi:hypothetical protein
MEKMKEGNSGEPNRLTVCFIVVSMFVTNFTRRSAATTAQMLACQPAGDGPDVTYHFADTLPER